MRLKKYIEKEIRFLVLLIYIADRRRGLCFSKLIHGRCTTHNRETKKVTKADCCCTMGEAWGPNCEICPSKYSPQYQDLCLESGFTVDGQGLFIINMAHTISLIIIIIIVSGF